MSFPVNVNYEDAELSQAFAGVRMIAATMGIAGDTSMVPDRGSSFATFAIQNSSSAPYAAWGDAMNNLGQGGSGFGCPGGYGYNGCGCQWMQAIGTTVAAAKAVSQETWVNIPFDDLDATGEEYYSWQVTCNYNFHTYPFNLP